MNEVIRAMVQRRSIRKYKPDMVPKALIDQVIEAGLYAPSARGLQSPVIIAVTNRELRDAIAEENRKIGGWDAGFDPFYGAPVILLVIADKSAPNAIYDGSTTLANMSTAAYALGLGSCWIHRAKEEMESDFGKALLKRLGITGDYIGIGHLALGYADCELPAPAARKEGRCYYID